MHSSLFCNMLSIHMTRMSSLSIIALTLVVTVSSNSVNSPTLCISDLECPSTFFCNNTYFSQLPQCLSRLPENSLCYNINNIDPRECQDELTCVDDPASITDSVCRPRVYPLPCQPNTTACPPFTDGFAGTPCQLDEDSRCQQDKGFYCQSEAGVCAPRRRDGEECGLTGDNFECLGVCAFQSFGNGNGICVSARKEGDLCTADYQCENPFFDEFGLEDDYVICNIPTGFVGRCIRESRLITQLGAKCDPDQDNCDARRTLSCHPTRDGDHLCQHRTSRFYFSSQEHCEPHSRLSHCSFRDEKTECRLERAFPGQSAPSDPGPFFVCRRKSENVARGGVCITEYAACANGTECREVPGVRSDPDEEALRFLQARVAFCVHIAKQGEHCGDVSEKFTTQCENGLRCENGTCSKAESNEVPFDETVTHAGLRGSCSDLPCAPGLVCDNDEFDSTKRCLLPLKIVGKGRACSDRAVKRLRCKNGLVCALRKDGTNIRRCREPREAGDYCDAHGVCAEGLVCPVTVRLNRLQEDRRCYDPKTTLSLGDACDHEASASQPGCVLNERPDESVPNETKYEPMRCMPKADGFACQVVVGFFELCDEAKDIACDIGLKCGKLGICVSSGRISQ